MATTSRFLLKLVPVLVMTVYMQLSLLMFCAANNAFADADMSAKVYTINIITRLHVENIPYTGVERECKEAYFASCM